MDQTFKKLFYSPQGYWRGESAVDRLHEKTGADKSVVRNWLKKQAVWQIYLPKPHYVPRPTMLQSESVEPNYAHQMDVLYLPWDRVKRKTFKYALTVVDVGSRYKEAEPLNSKTAEQVSEAIKKIYERSPLTWPKFVMVDSGTEFKGEFKRLMTKNKVQIQVGEPGVHRSQGIVERFNRTLAERLFGHQYAQEMLNVGVRNVEWVERLPQVVKSLNEEKTRLIDAIPAEAIKLSKRATSGASITGVKQAPSTPVRTTQRELPPDAVVRYLYYPGEQEGGTVRRATDPIWSVNVYQIEKRTSQFKRVTGKRVKTGPTLYYLLNGPNRSFVKEELQVVPEDTELPN